MSTKADAREFVEGLRPFVPSASAIASFTILGPPRTKKNHGRVIVRGGRRFHIQSIAYEQWHDVAMVHLAGIRVALRLKRVVLPVSGSIQVRATFYRDRLAGDLVGYEQALGDVLEETGIIQNDKLIYSWDGTRLDLDRVRPRIEVEIVP